MENMDQDMLSTASANVLINGSPSGDFRMEQGLRQGDALSPFMYLIVAESLNILVTKAVEENLFETAEMGKNKIKVSLLQYADDTIFIGSASRENSWAMIHILRNFEILSNLKVNYDECSLMGVNVDNERLEDLTRPLGCVIGLEDLARPLGCVIGSVPFLYLGIKAGINHRRLSEWSHLTHKTEMKLKKWDDKKISFGGRITLLKSVLLSIIYPSIVCPKKQ